MSYNKHIEYYFFEQKFAGYEEQEDWLIVPYKTADGLVDLRLAIRKHSEEHFEVRYKIKANPYVVASIEWMCCQINQGVIERFCGKDRQFWIEYFEIPRKELRTAIQIQDIYQLLLSKIT